MDNHLLKRDDSRLSYSMSEIFAKIKEAEDEAIKEWQDENRGDYTIRMWVKTLNMNTITDEQIDQVKKTYEDNGWKKVVVERHEERYEKSLYICLYL